MLIAATASVLCAVLVAVSALYPRNGSSMSGLEPQISELKTNVHRILEGSRIRKKRELQRLNDESDYKLRVGSATEKDLPYLSDYNLTFWIPVQHMSKHQVLIGTTKGHIILLEISDTDDSIATTVAISDVEDNTIQAKAFSHHDEQWFAVLHSSSDGYYIRLYLRFGRGLERRQKIELTGFSDMEMITMKGMHYLVVASYSTVINEGFTYQASITLYHWARTQFDAIAWRSTNGARSVTCWDMDGSLYIAVAQEIDDKENYKVGSPIFIYNSKEENRLVLWEMLSTFGPTKVRHFKVAGSHYVIFTGMQDAVIYWWSSGQFLVCQPLSGTAFASDASVLVLKDGEVAIVIALKEEAFFYTLDSSGNYIQTFYMSFKESSLESLQFIYTARAYYALALFAEPNPQSFWKLTLAQHYMPPVSLLDTLQQCLLDSEDLLKHRQMELEVRKSDLKRVWLKDGNQTISSKVVVKGKIISQSETKVKDIIIVRYTKLPSSSMSHVKALLMAAQQNVNQVKDDVDAAVYKSIPQEIRGNVTFSDLLYVPSLTMESIDHDVRINDVEVSRLKNNALKKSGDQTFSDTAVISNLYAESAHISTLNGISTDDLLLLHGKQIVTGDLEFLNVKGNSISTNSINSIPVENIVTTNGMQDIKELKTFSYLHSDAVDVLQQTNGEDLEAIGKKIATFDNYNAFSGKLTFAHPLTVNSSLFLTGKINRQVDISELVANSVNCDAQQDLSGLYTFKHELLIDGDLHVVGHVNHVFIDNLLTLNTNQIVYGDMSLSALTVASDLEVNLVNGADLSEQVLRKTLPHQFVTGQKIFSQNMTADFIDMTDFVTLDGVDPSMLAQDIVKHKEGIVKPHSIVLKDVTVLGNATAIEGINGFQVIDLPSLVWLKSKPQAIGTTVKANVIHFKNNLKVGTVNGLDLERDIVNSFSDEEISSSKTFEHKITTKVLKVDEMVYINGINPSSYKKHFDRYKDKDAIHGSKIINNLEIAGNLVVNKFNNMGLDNVMRPNAPQTVLGSVEFDSEITTVLHDLNLDSISFELFNNMDLRNYFRRAVLANHQRAVKNKRFSHITAFNLSLGTGSTIDGVNLEEMKRRVVTLNTPQKIEASKSFSSDLHFSGLFNVSNLNGMDITRYLSEVVLTDDVSVVSGKKLMGNVQSTNVFVNGLVNGLDIQDISDNVFYKSEDNVVTEPFVFNGDVDIGDLLAPSAIDGVTWENLIFIKENEDLGVGWFLSSAHAGSDVFVSGHLNGCDLSQLASKSLHTHEKNQTITEVFKIQNVTIVGNLNVKNLINGVSIVDLQNIITTNEDQVISSDIIIEADLTANKFDFTNLLNNEDIEFILGDAVRHSIPQVIYGQKVFKTNMNIHNLKGGDLHVHKLDGIDLEILKETTVQKIGYQEIGGDKIFTSLNISVMAVNGKLNGITLPEDVILANTSEHITHPTYFMSDVFVTTGLEVHGLIDGVDLTDFIANRITLTTDQNFTAQLVFNEDVTIRDSLLIDGTINEIVLELVAKTRPVHPLQGYKVFVELLASGDVSATLVNGHDVHQLAQNVLKFNQEDFINEIQVFEKPITAQTSLFTEWINNISLRGLISTFHLMNTHFKTIVGFLEDLSAKLQHQLVHQLTLSQERVSKFAYFILLQEINLGPTNRILHGFPERGSSKFSHSMVIWTTQKQCAFMERCCYLEFSYTAKVKKSGHMMIDTGEEHGKKYPVYSPDPIAYNQDSFIWTNNTQKQPKWCGEKPEKMYLATYNHEGRLEVFIDVDGAPILSDVKSFRKGNNVYLVAGFYYNTENGEYSSTVVYTYNEFKKVWSEYQILPSFGVLSLDLIKFTKSHQEEILLTLGTGMDIIPDSYSTVYRWNNRNRVFEKVVDISSRFVTSTLWIRNGKDLLLCLAGVEQWPSYYIDCSEIASGGQIDIYIYGEQVQLTQSIPLGGVVSMVSFTLEDEIFLAAASTQEQSVSIYEWQGYSKFVKIQSIPVGEVSHLNTYSIDDDIYMTVASVSGSSKILKLVQKGKHFMQTEEFNPITLEQKDENISDQKLISGC